MMRFPKTDYRQLTDHDLALIAEMDAAKLTDLIVIPSWRYSDCDQLRSELADRLADAITSGLHNTAQVATMAVAWDKLNRAMRHDYLCTMCFTRFQDTVNRALLRQPIQCPDCGSAEIDH